MREHETLGLRSQRDLGSLFGGGVTGVAGTLALFLAERCLVNQQVRLLCGIHRRGAGPRVAADCDEPAGPRDADKAIGRQLSAVSKLDRFALRQLPPRRSFGNPCGLRLLDIKPATTHVLSEEISERRTAAVFSGKRADVVGIPLGGTGYGISGLDFDDLDGKRYALDAELHRRGQHLLRALGTIQEEWLRPPLQAQRPNQSNDAQEMIGVKVGEEDFGQRKAHPVAHHLALRAFAALEQQRLALAMNGEARDISFYSRP